MWKNCVCELFRNELFDEALKVCDTAPDAALQTNLVPVRVLLLAESGDIGGAKRELQRLGDQDRGPYQAMYLALIARVLGMNDWADELCSRAAPPDNPFGQALLSYNRGKIDAGKLLAVAKDEFENAEAHFHIAHLELGFDRATQAAEHFRIMAAPNAYYHHEYRWARAFLERIEKDPDWPASIRAPSTRTTD